MITDSLSSIQALENAHSRLLHPIWKKILQLTQSIDTSLTFAWEPGHKGNTSNKVANTATKEAAHLFSWFWTITVSHDGAQWTCSWSTVDAHSDYAARQHRRHSTVHFTLQKSCFQQIHQPLGLTSCICYFAVHTMNTLRKLFAFEQSNMIYIYRAGWRLQQPVQL